MVVIQVKRTEKDFFLYECRTTDSNDKIIRELCQIHNLREKIIRMASACQDLGKHGPSKPEAERGIDEIQEKAGKVIEKGPHYNPDPLGDRTGNAPEPKLRDVLQETSEQAMELVTRSNSNVALTVAALQEKLDLLRGAVMMAFPQGLPDNDPVRLFIEDDGKPEGFLATQMGNDYMDPDTACLWWAGKEFFRDETIGDRVGRNEKTKVIAKLQKQGGGPPAREAAISEEERAAMMAWYFKKQEEMKKLAEDDDDSYLSNRWADPTSLKRDLIGTTGLAYRPGRQM